MFVRMIRSDELRVNGVCPKKLSELGGLSELSVLELSGAYYIFPLHHT